MSDERATLPETDAFDLANELALEGDPAESSVALPRPAVLSEILKIRWDTPRGRRVRSLVVRDVRFEKSAHLAEILRELRGSDEVKGFLDLRWIKLDGENLNGTHLEGVDLTGASLAKTGLVSANLRGARLAKARLVGASLREADVSRADFADANLAEACCDGTVMVSCELARARCIGASFRGASLVGANLRGAMLVRAVFEGADLGGASVEDAHALPRAFELASQKPNGMAQVNEVACGAPEPARTSPPIELPRPERGRTGVFRMPETSRERRPTGSFPALDANARWDAALASLLTQRGRVGKITAVIDGVEKVIFTS
jgi:hypothetical protein